MKLGRLQTLADSELRTIHEQALQILQIRGVHVLSPKVLDFLGSFSGVQVDRHGALARFRTELVTSRLGKAPASFTLFDRQGREAVTLGGDDCHLVNGHCAIFAYDVESGLRRPVTMSDVEVHATLAERLPAVRIVGIQGTPQEVEASQAFRWGACATLCHSSKPFHFTPETSADNRAVLEMVRILTGDDCAGSPSVLVQHTPMSPLCWPVDIVEMLIANASQGIPVVVLSAPYSGVTSPYPLAGQLSLIHAEVLSGITMTQLARPGTPVVWGSSCATFDMRTLQVLIGTPESVLLRIGAAQLARFCGIPSMTTAPDTDAHTPDQQTAWEKAQTMFCSLAAGTNVLCNAGMFSTGTAVCPEQLLIDAELFANCVRMLRGIAVAPETLAINDILGLTKGGTFIEARSTLGLLHSDEHARPSLACRQNPATWEQQGALSVERVARHRVQELLSERSTPDLPREKLRAIEELCRRTDSAPPASSPPSP